MNHPDIAPVVDIFEHLLKIAEGPTPRAARVYLWLWPRLDEEQSFVVTREWVTHDMSASWTVFKNELRALARQCFLEWHEIDENSIKVTFIDPFGAACA